MRDEWKFIPCRPQSKEPWTRYATHGHKSAKPLSEWGAVPADANWGIACAASGLVVVDVDQPEIPAVCPPTYTVRTGRGWHLYYRAEPDSRFVGKLSPHVDIKHNGYVIAANSIHPSGVQYVCVVDREPQPLSQELAGLITR